MLRYLKSWTLQLRWQRLPPFEKLAHMLIDHLDGILNYCRVKVGSASWKPSTATSKPYSDAAADTRTSGTSSRRLSVLAVTKTEVVAFQKAA